MTSELWIKLLVLFVVVAMGWTAGRTRLLGGGDTSGYASSKDGKMLIEAFIKAFNGVTDQGVALQAMRPAGS